MAKAPNWTDEELVKLKEAYPRLGRCEELQNLFPNRPLEGICLKANRIGLRVTNNIRKGRTNEEYLALVQNTNFVPLEEYVGSTKPILHFCCICENEWLARPQHILREGAKCPTCDLVSRMNSTSKVQKVLSDAGFTQLSEYTGSLNPIKLKHNSCGYEWTTAYSYVQQGSGCPACNVGFGNAQVVKGTPPETAFIYLFKIKTLYEEFLKVGVTSRADIRIRQRELKSAILKLEEIELIHLVKDSGINILNKERLILSSFKKHTAKHSFAGHTELLSIDSNITLIKEIMNENISTTN